MSNFRDRFPSTPCIGVCRVDRGQCIGCLRTLAEIAAWPRMSEAERLHLMEQVLPARRHSREAKKSDGQGKEIGEENV